MSSTSTARVTFQSLCMLAAIVLAGCSQQPLTPLEQAEANFKRGQWGLAVESCATVLATDADNCEALSIRARSLAALGQYDLALADLNRWIELAPQDPEPLYHRAIAYEKLGETELAHTDRNNAKAVDPLHKKAYVYDLSKPAAVTPHGRKKTKELTDSSDKTINDSFADDSTTEDDVATQMTSPAARRAATEQTAEESAREEAIWNRIRRGEQLEHPASSDGSSTEGLADVVKGKDPLAKDKPRAVALDKIAEKMFDTDEQQNTPLAQPPPITPAPPAISTALPADPYGNLYVPGQQPLGANPNTGYSTPYPNYSAQPGYGGSIPPGYGNAAPGFGPNSYSNPVSTAIPPQLYGKLGTNAGVNQYGGMMYPGSMSSSASATQGGIGYGAAAGGGYGTTPYGQGSTALPMPNYNPLTPAPPTRPGLTPNYGVRPPAGARQPVSTALPQDYLQQQIQPNYP